MTPFDVVWVGIVVAFVFMVVLTALSGSGRRSPGRPPGSLPQRQWAEPATPFPPPPGYREAARRRATEDRFDALERDVEAMKQAEHARTMREMPEKRPTHDAQLRPTTAAGNRMFCTRIHMDLEYCKPDCPGRALWQEAFKRETEEAKR